MKKIGFVISFDSPEEKEEFKKRLFEKIKPLLFAEVEERKTS